MDNWAEIRRRVLVDGLSQRAACRLYEETRTNRGLNSGVGFG